MVNNRISTRLGSALLAVVLSLAACSRQQSDWQKARETNTADGYELFLKKYPSGEFTAEAQARMKQLYEERDWQKARDADTPEAYQAFLKQYPEGKWTEEARIRVENFTLAQAPGSGAAPPAAPPAPPAAAPVRGGPGGPAAATAAVPASPPVPTPAATPDLKPTAQAAAGSFGVQLGAFKSGASAAHAHWARLQSQYPKLLAGLSSRVSPKHTAAGKLYRLQAIGMTEQHARDLCQALKAQSQACVVLPKAHG